jgi:hypothetical protein
MTFNSFKKITFSFLFLAISSNQSRRVSEREEKQVLYNECTEVGSWQRVSLLPVAFNLFINNKFAHAL